MSTVTYRDAHGNIHTTYVDESEAGKRAGQELTRRFATGEIERVLDFGPQTRQELPKPVERTRLRSWLRGE
jgi:hypothetical protein